MAKLRTDRGIYRYRPVALYAGYKVMNPEKGLDNLKALMPILEKAGIFAAPTYGTLLGMVRDGIFILWDEDIDLVMFSEDEQKLRNLLWTLREAGFELIRYDKRGLYSIMRQGEYIDFYVMYPTPDPRVRYSVARDFILEKHLRELEPFEFKGMTLLRPVDYDGFLRLNYGDWRTPRQYYNYGMNRVQVFSVRFKEWTKTLIPKRWYPAVIRRYQKKYLKAFLDKVTAEGIIDKEEQA